MECIQANQIFPKKSPVLEEENMQVRKPLQLAACFVQYEGENKLGDSCVNLS